MKRFLLAFVLLGCSTKTGDAPPGTTSLQSPTSPTSAPQPPQPSGEGWTVDVKTCERNVIKRRTYDGGADSLTIVGPDQDVCVVHVKHTVGRDWTEADCRLPRTPGTVTVTSTAMDRMPGTCSLVESGTESR